METETVSANNVQRSSSSTHLVVFPEYRFNIEHLIIYEAVLPVKAAQLCKVGAGLMWIFAGVNWYIKMCTAIR